MVDEIKRLREVKARLEAENLEEACTEAALAAKVQALQQTKLQLEDDIRKASLRGHFLRKVDQRKVDHLGL